jgi:hypothetical protein
MASAKIDSRERAPLVEQTARIHAIPDVVDDRADLLPAIGLNIIAASVVTLGAPENAPLLGTLAGTGIVPSFSSEQPCGPPLCALSTGRPVSNS